MKRLITSVAQLASVLEDDAHIEISGRVVLMYYSSYREQFCKYSDKKQTYINGGDKLLKQLEKACAKGELYIIPKYDFPEALYPTQHDGWMSPEGTYYPCGYCKHSACAVALTGKGVHDLEMSGWIHISSSEVANFTQGRRLCTQSQRDRLFDMVMVNPNSRFGENIQAFLAD